MEGDEELVENSPSAHSSAACPTPGHGTPKTAPAQTNGRCGLEKPTESTAKGIGTAQGRQRSPREGNGQESKEQLARAEI